ncbi:MAG: DUF1573 domain-containing protein [Planctomycetia bacterium]|nr:DUF1573 domain-containing protein [Planctomycetia bacterium]
MGCLSRKYGSFAAALGYLRGRQLLILPEVLDLGDGELGERRAARLQIVNLTDRPAKLLGANSSCSCLVLPKDVPAEIPGHESRWLPIVLAFSGKGGEFWQIVTVYSDVAGGGSASAIVKGRIPQPLVNAE